MGFVCISGESAGNIYRRRRSWHLHTRSVLRLGIWKRLSGFRLLWTNKHNQNPSEIRSNQPVFKLLPLPIRNNLPHNPGILKPSGLLSSISHFEFVSQPFLPSPSITSSVFPTISVGAVAALATRRLRLLLVTVIRAELGSGCFLRLYLRSHRVRAISVDSIYLCYLRVRINVIPVFVAPGLTCAFRSSSTPGSSPLLSAEVLSSFFHSATSQSSSHSRTASSVQYMTPEKVAAALSIKVSLRRSVPLAFKSLTMFLRSLSAAWSIAALPWLSVAARFAPWSSSRLTVSLQPHQAAQPSLSLMSSTAPLSSKDYTILLHLHREILLLSSRVRYSLRAVMNVCAVLQE